MSFLDTLSDAIQSGVSRVRAWTGVDEPLVPLVRLEGMIAAGARNSAALSLARVEKTLDRAFSFKTAPAIALVINSPGGSPVQARLIHDRIRALAEEKRKPVLVFCEDVAASGGYMLACAGEEIYCDPASILGSIGVISAGFGFQDAMAKLGVERRLKTAGQNKSLGDPFLPETDEQKQVLERIMTGVHAQFIALVKARRVGKLNDAIEAFDGSVFTGEEALEAGLADAIGEARSELRRRFGDKVRIRQLAPARIGPLSRLVGSVIDGVEARGVWARFGL